mgnify:CR=1 FL=1
MKGRAPVMLRSMVIAGDGLCDGDGLVKRSSSTRTRSRQEHKEEQC